MSDRARKKTRINILLTYGFKKISKEYLYGVILYSTAQNYRK